MSTRLAKPFGTLPALLGLLLAGGAGLAAAGATPLVAATIPSWQVGGMVQPVKIVSGSDTLPGDLGPSRPSPDERTPESDEKAMVVEESFQRAEAVVRALLSAHWEVEEAELVLDWGEAARNAIPRSFHTVDLLGSGARGHWVVALDDLSPEGGRVQVTLKAGANVTVPVASRSLSREEILAEGDIDYQSLVHWGDPRDRGPMAEPGWVVQRILRAGDLLDRPSTAPPKVVRSGQPVQIMWERGTLSVTVMGRAAGSARTGETVYVRTETGLRLRGVASGFGKVMIPSTSLEEMR